MVSIGTSQSNMKAVEGRDVKLSKFIIHFHGELKSLILRTLKAPEQQVSQIDWPFETEATRRCPRKVTARHIAA